MCGRRWIWGRIGCNRSRVKNIADGNKRSSYVFLAVWISLQCNFSGKSFCLFLIFAVDSAVYTRVHIYIRAHPFQKKMFSCIMFLRVASSQKTFLRGRACSLSLLAAFCVRCFCCETKYRYTRSRVQLHWIMNELTCFFFFSDDNGDECHLGVIWLLRCARCQDLSPEFILESLGYAFWSSALLKLMMSFYLFWISDSIVFDYWKVRKSFRGTGKSCSHAVVIELFEHLSDRSYYVKLYRHKRGGDIALLLQN